MSQLRRPARDHQDLVARGSRILWATLLALCLAGCSDGRLAPTGGMPLDTAPSVQPCTTILPSASETSAHPLVPLANRVLPARDDAALALALGPHQAETAFDPWLASERVGDHASFWVADLQAGRMRRIRAVCVAVGRHASMWFDEGLDTDAATIEAAAHSFDTLIYPTVRQVLGGTALPPDGRVAIVHTELTAGIAYFARANLQPDGVYAHSNERAMLVINPAHVQPGDDAYPAVLAHELQHLAHNVGDPTEDAWFSEGMSQLAEDLCGCARPERAASLLAHPDHPLLRWHADPALAQHDYAAAYLFVRYLADRFGLATIAELAQHHHRAVDSIDALLAWDGGMDGVFADWLMANLLNDSPASAGEFAYETVSGHVTPTPLNPSATNVVTDTVANYGADYWSVDLANATQVRIGFEGDAYVSLGPAEARQDQRVWWSQRGDGIHTWLEATVDLRGLVTATLEQQLWFDIESGWDYGYLRVSTDDGATWDLLPTAATSPYDPLGYAMGPGYTGSSGCAPDDDQCEPRWTVERVVLDPYCGQEVCLRRDYITDEAVTGDGMFVGKMSLTGMTHDRVLLSEALAAGNAPTSPRMSSKADGFVQTTTLVPQSWLLLVVEMGQEVDVHQIPVGPDGKATWALAAETLSTGNTHELVVIVAATHRLSDDRPTYRLSVDKLP